MYRPAAAVRIATSPRPWEAYRRQGDNSLTRCAIDRRKGLNGRGAGPRGFLPLMTVSGRDARLKKSPRYRQFSTKVVEPLRG